MSTRKNFISKIFEIVNDPNTDGFIRWADDGESFVITDESELTRILPVHFKHSNLSSLVRQLHQYGFSKSSGDEGEMVFKNDLFLKGHDELLESIHRKGQNTVASLKAENEDLARRLQELENEKASLLKENLSLTYENDLLKSKIESDSLFPGDNWGSTKMEVDDSDYSSTTSSSALTTPLSGEDMPMINPMLDLEGFSLPSVDFFAATPVKRLEVVNTNANSSAATTAPNDMFDPLDEMMVKTDDAFWGLTRNNSNLLDYELGDNGNLWSSSDPMWNGVKTEENNWYY